MRISPDAFPSPGNAVAQSSRDIVEDWDRRPRPPNPMTGEITWQRYCVQRVAILAVLCSTAIAFPALANSAMSFFVTSSGKGNGADLGGREGADAHCAALAPGGGLHEVRVEGVSEHHGPRRECRRNARGRIAKGEPIARSADDLHSEGNRPRSPRRARSSAAEGTR